MNKIVTFAVLLGLSAQPVFVLAHEGHVHSDTEVNVGVDSGININATTGTKIESDSSATATSSGTESSTDSNATIELGADAIIITADDVDDAEATLSSTAEVNSETTLSAYARGVIKANANVRDVIINNNHIAVSHRERARLFGILPITVFARAYVKNDGSVEVKFPWYAFASAKKAAIESRVATAVRPSFSADASVSAKTQAEVLEKTVAAMKTEFETDASANTNAQVQ